MNYAIKIIYHAGDEAFVCDGRFGKVPSRFTKRDAEKMVRFLKMGMEDEVQSFNVVRYPKTQRKENTKCKPSKNV